MIFSAFLFAFLLGAFIFGVLPRARLGQQVLSVGLFVLLVAVVYGGGIELLGRPKPIRLEWQPPAEADVLGAHAVENQAIYVWLSLPDAPEPRAYVLPWSQKAAEQLQTAEQRASERGTGIKVRLTFGSGSDSDEGRFTRCRNRRFRLRMHRAPPSSISGQLMETLHENPVRTRGWDRTFRSAYQPGEAFTW